MPSIMEPSSTNSFNDTPATFIVVAEPILEELEANFGEFKLESADEEYPKNVDTTATEAAPSINATETAETAETVETQKL